MRVVGRILDKRYKEDRTIERAVDTVFEVAQWQASPYEYLYHNPHAIRTIQYFAHWAQRWTNRMAYIAVLQAANIGGFEVVPSALTYRNAKRDGLSKRGLRVGALRFYLIKKEEMAPGLLRRYEKFRKALANQLSRHNNDNPTAFDIADSRKGW